MDNNMDMKKILQAMDNASSNPVEGATDIKRSLEVLTEGANPHKISLPVQMAMNHYQKNSDVKEARSSLLKKYIAEAEDDIQSQKELEQLRIAMYSRKIANRVLVKESASNPQNDRVMQQNTQKEIAQLSKTLENLKYAHSKAKEITREIKYDDIPSGIITRIRELAKSVNVESQLESAESYVFEAIRNLESSIYELDDVFGEAARDIEYKIDELQGTLDEIEWQKKYGRSSINESINPEDKVTMDIPLLLRVLEYAKEDAKTDMDLHNVTDMLINLSKNGQTLSMDQYDQIVGNQKLLPEPATEGSHDPCWKGFRKLGSRMKGGRKVPHCVPKK
jgi:hypothetical protein